MLTPVTKRAWTRFAAGCMLLFAGTFQATNCNSAPAPAPEVVMRLQRNLLDSSAAALVPPKLMGTSGGPTIAVVSDVLFCGLAGNGDATVLIQLTSPKSTTDAPNLAFSDCGTPLSTIVSAHSGKPGFDGVASAHVAWSNWQLTFAIDDVGQVASTPFPADVVNQLKAFVRTSPTDSISLNSGGVSAQFAIAIGFSQNGINVGLFDSATALDQNWWPADLPLSLGDDSSSNMIVAFASDKLSSFLASNPGAIQYIVPGTSITLQNFAYGTDTTPTGAEAVVSGSYTQNAITITLASHWQGEPLLFSSVIGSAQPSTPFTDKFAAVAADLAKAKLNGRFLLPSTATPLNTNLFGRKVAIVFNAHTSGLHGGYIEAQGNGGLNSAR